MSNTTGNTPRNRKTAGTASIPPNKAGTITPNAATRSQRLLKAAQRRRARMRLWTRLFTWGLFGCFIVLAGFAARTLMGISGNGKQSGGIQGMTRMIDTMVNPHKQFPEKKRLNILLVGKDYEYTNKGIRYTKTSRADTIMLLSLDLEKQTVSAISIPRDTRVTPPDGKTGKINAVFRAETHVGGGIEMLKDTVSDLLGVPIDYHLILKPDAVKAVVDSVGGVDVETLDKMQYDDSQAGLHVDLPAGKQRIDGTQAIGFVRFREPDMVLRDAQGKPLWVMDTGGKIAKNAQGNPIPQRKTRDVIYRSKEEGDFRRQSRQQQLIRAVASEAKKPNNWLHVDSIVQTAFAQLDTNLSNSQVMALGAIFKGMDPNSMLSTTLPGKLVSGGSYYVPNPDSIHATVDWLVHGDETASYRLTHVVVQNASQVPGVGRRVVEILKDRGFQVNAAETVETTEPAATTKIVYSKQIVKTRAEKIASLVGASPSLLVKETMPDMTGVMQHAPGERIPPDVTLVIGQDIAQHLAVRSASR
jgi:polyisoprenyl-teichoic acid--peptidoglycan teichoic acid transferase